MGAELNTAPSPALPSAPGSPLSFTQGFVLGQISISLLIFLFIKFFIFGEPPPADVRASHLASHRHQRTLSHARRQAAASTALSSTDQSTTPPSLLRKRSSRVLARQNAYSSAAPISTRTILAKTYYNVHAHQPESLDWFNVLVAQTLAQLRADAVADDAILHQLTEVLNRPGAKPDWIGEVRVTEVALGEEFPILSNCRVVAGSEEEEPGGSKDGRLQARLDVDLSDVITLGVETTLVLNYPRPLCAVLPVALSVSLVRFSGTLSLSFTPAPPSPMPQTTTSSSSSANALPTAPTGQLLTFTFLDDYRLDLSVRSLLGSRSRLQDVPKIAQLVENRLHAWFDERCVEPRFQQIQLPSLWPRKRNARGGEEEEKEEDEEDDLREDTRGKGTDAGTDSKEVKEGEGGTRSDLDTGMRVDALEAMDESRLVAEGGKIWEAEQRALKNDRLRGREREGMRWRGDSSRDASLSGGRNSDSPMRIPGAMPGMVMS
ncbi:MAG: ERMES complex subunit mmm1 [Bathelium mastoideum]|nr:MAG: ERMES complex subunit mmm1 [Bathelium mastoideum]KAI9687565.1 MAG: ERMES complex subunit mmm1 [Bathelium mastoideum]